MGRKSQISGSRQPNTVIIHKKLIIRNRIICFQDYLGVSGVYLGENQNNFMRK